MLFDPIHRFPRSSIFDIISWILLSKNVHFNFLTVPLNTFQFFSSLENLYFANFNWYLLFHYTLKCLVILMHFKCLYQMISDLCANFWTADSSDSLLLICSVSILLIVLIKSMMNLYFSSLFLIIIHHLLETNPSIIKISTDSRVWSDE